MAPRAGGRRSRKAGSPPLAEPALSAASDFMKSSGLAPLPKRMVRISAFPAHVAKELVERDHLHAQGLGFAENSVQLFTLAASAVSVGLMPCKRYRVSEVNWP